MTGEAERRRLQTIADRSVQVITANQYPSGAYLASPNFPVYRYSWLRDGAFIADAMSRAGHIGSAEAFFGWCTRVVCDRLGQIEELIARRRDGQPIGPGEFLHTRFTVDGDETGEEWTDFQLDGYGVWLWALDEHRRRHGRLIDPFRDGAIASARYVAAFWDHPSYDWWEEHLHERHTSTLGALYGGLAAVAGWPSIEAADGRSFAAAAAAIRETVRGDAQRLGHLSKWLGGDAVDASLLAVGVPFRLVDPADPLMRATLAEIEQRLTVDGGVYRYLGDTYFGGGRWLLLAGFLGWHLSSIGRTEDAWRELRWIAGQASPEGDLPEQVLDRPLAPASVGEWVDRWGPVATPLLWSHAMYLTLALELGAVIPGDVGPGVNSVGHDETGANVAAR